MKCTLTFYECRLNGEDTENVVGNTRTLPAVIKLVRG